MSQTKTFLELYKNLEVLLREKGQTVLKYEDILTQEESDKLRICRQMRNYIFHHGDGEEFLICSQAMCEFLSALIQEEKEGKSSRTNRIQPVLITDRLSDIRAAFSKNNRTWMPIVDSDGMYVGSLDMLQFIRLSSNHGDYTRLSGILPSGFFSASSIATLRTQREIDEFSGIDAVITDADGIYLGVLR